MERIENLTVETFLKELAEPSFSGPASGSAAATIAGMSVALLEMSYKVTMKKSEVNLPIDIDKLVEVRHQCLTLATEDMEVLDSIIKAIKTKKEFPEIYETAVKNATETLICMIKNLEWIMKQIEQFIPICVKSVIPELIASAHMANAALESAKLGVEANLNLLQDVSYIENTQNIIQNIFKLDL